jgi:hypothetical protein
MTSPTPPDTRPFWLGRERSLIAARLLLPVEGPNGEVSTISRTSFERRQCIGTAGRVLVRERIDPALLEGRSEEWLRRLESDLVTLIARYRGMRPRYTLPARVPRTMTDLEFMAYQVPDYDAVSLLAAIWALSPEEQPT